MAISEVAIANLALQKLGAARIVSLTEDSRNARTINSCYEFMRDRELRANAWNFAIKRASLAASSTAPTFDFDRAFPVPADFLRLLPPPILYLDWTIENHLGSPAILTNDTAPLEIRYIARITDPTKFDTIFIDMLACKIAWHCCEEITQSNTKKAEIQKEYTDSKNDAKKINAFEKIEEPGPEDPWVAARMVGLRNWLNGPWVR